MKANTTLIQKFLKERFNKISTFLNYSIVSAKKGDSKKNKKSSYRKKSFSLFKRISKLEKYQNIIEKLSQFKKEENISQKSMSKTSKRKERSFSLINKFSKSKTYQKIIASVNIFNFLNYEQKKSKRKNTLSSIYSNTILKKQDYLRVINKVKSIKLLNFKSIRKEKVDNKKFDQKIGIIFYGDHNLIFISLFININNKIKIDGVTEIPIPGNVIGDSVVEDTNELANIVLDTVNLLELNSSPLLVVLSSSFFKIHTFQASDLKQISQSDKRVQSKSPYLPVNTMVDFLKLSDTDFSNRLIRVTYAKKEFIKGWTDTLEIIDLPVIGLIPAASNIFDYITEKVIEDTTILIDIESSSTTLLIGSKLAKLTSHKLPFGSSLYVSSDLGETSINYFDRVLNSINLILNEEDKKLSSNVFVMGSGLDKLISKDANLPKGFKKISDLNLTNLSYIPKSMKIHELISTSIDSSIYSLSSILSKCV